MARERKFLNSLDQHAQSENDRKRKQSDVLMTLYLPVGCNVDPTGSISGSISASAFHVEAIKFTT
jgi:hypothetical protein